MYLVIKTINPESMDCLKALLWQFDIDMRRIFVSMGKSVNTMNERLLDSIMPMVWTRKSLSAPQARIPAIQVKIFIFRNDKEIYSKGQNVPWGRV